MSESIQLSVIFPCFNEEESVQPVLTEALQSFKERQDVEVIVVDDGSSDDSLIGLEKFSNSIRIIRHKENLGYGAALKTGAFYAKGTFIAFMDFDGTCKAKEALSMLDRIQSTDSDMVMGIRLHRSSKMPRTRRLGNSLYKGLLRTLYPFHQELPQDVCTGFRLLKKSVAEDLFDRLPNDLSFSPALTTKALKKNYKLIDFEITYRERFGTSKIALLKDGVNFGKAMLAERFL